MAFLFIPFCFSFSAGDGMQSFVHDKQVSYHWAMQAILGRSSTSEPCPPASPWGTLGMLSTKSHPSPSRLHSSWLSCSSPSAYSIPAHCLTAQSLAPTSAPNNIHPNRFIPLDCTPTCCSLSTLWHHQGHFQTGPGPCSFTSPSNSEKVAFRDHSLDSRTTSPGSHILISMLYASSLNSLTKHMNHITHQVMGNIPSTEGHDLNLGVSALGRTWPPFVASLLSPLSSLPTSHFVTLKNPVLFPFNAYIQNFMWLYKIRKHVKQKSVSLRPGLIQLVRWSPVVESTFLLMTFHSSLWLKTIAHCV